MSKTTELRVAGQTYRVKSPMPDETLVSLAAELESRVYALTPRGRAINPQALFLVALTTLHELRETRAALALEQQTREGVTRKTRDVLRRTLSRIDEAIEREQDLP
jgi:cell division protein ZapA (FtsZ GTPase activity inhibitor)